MKPASKGTTIVQRKFSNHPEKIRAIFPYTSEKNFCVSYELRNIMSGNGCGCWWVPDKAANNFGVRGQKWLVSKYDTNLQGNDDSAEKKFSNRPEKIRTIFPYTSEKKLCLCHKHQKHLVGCSITLPTGNAGCAPPNQRIRLFANTLEKSMLSHRNRHYPH